jgi:rhodanese-related sulfurtransferase
MRKISIVTSLTCLILMSCSNSKATGKSNPENTPEPSKVAQNNQVSDSATNKPTTQDPEMKAESQFKPNFIKADDLKKRMDQGEKVYLLDVRGDTSYKESHIKGAIQAPLPITEDIVKNVPKFATIVTYCGCPHHLSSIGAEQLTNLGYRNVSVLDEGFWYWKDHKYPLETAKTVSEITEMTFEGNLMKNNKPVSDVDIYLKHEKSGQLEATRTDAKGYYKMTFHIYNYEKNDLFKFYVEDLKNPVQEYKTEKKDNKDIIVNIK